MSFASKIKNEILRIDSKNRCCKTAELCGIVCFGGLISYVGDRHILKITTENAASARRCFSLIKKVFGISSDIDFSKGRIGKGGRSYRILVSKDEFIEKILQGLYLYDQNFKNHISFRINEKLVAKSCCKKALIRGAFIGGGSIANPEKGYHLEFVTHHLNLSADFSSLISEFGLNPKTIVRKSKYVIYFKDSDEIADVLNIIGAHKSLMEFMNIRIVKDTRNYVNRKVNCETANLDKTLNAAFLQVEAIEKLKAANAFDDLPDTLKELAQLRLKYKGASFKDLGKMINPPLTKSGVNHRFRKIIELSKKVGE